MNTRSILAFTALAGGVLLAGCGGHADSKQEAAAPTVPIAVNTATVTVEPAPRLLEGVGSVEAQMESVISARVPGYIQQIHVREGDHVRAGQLLVEIAASEMDAAVAQARAASQEAEVAGAEAESAIVAAQSTANLAEATLKRMRNLHERRSISDQEFDEAVARHEAAQANLRMARSRRQQTNERVQQALAAVRAAETQRSYLKITAPFAGVVSARLAEPGNLASPGTPILRLERAGGYRLVASFPESVLGNLKVGQTLPVAIAALGWETEGKITEVAPVVDPSSRTVNIKVSLPANSNLRSGVYGTTRVAEGTRDTLRVPASALRQAGQLVSVFVVTDGVARSRLVKLAQDQGEMREVLSGLNSGEVVVLHPPLDLRDGAAVEVRQ